MKRYLKEIIISLVAVLFMVLVITAYFQSVKEEKLSIQTDLYTLIPPNAMALLIVNNPPTFNRMMLSNQSLYEMFASEIPEIFLSVIKENQQMQVVFFSFHSQGVLCYMQAGSKTSATITKEILPAKFKPYSPQIQSKNGVDFYYYPDVENHFFGYYVHNGIWVGSYSSKLLERAALQQQNGKVLIPAEMIELRASFDKKGVNLLYPAAKLGINGLRWLPANLSVSDRGLDYNGRLPYKAEIESAYKYLADSLARRLEKKYPQLHILSPETTQEDDIVSFTGYSPVQPN
jgi:hypothetical protein